MIGDRTRGGTRYMGKVKNWTDLDKSGICTLDSYWNSLKALLKLSCLDAVRKDLIRETLSAKKSPLVLDRRLGLHNRVKLHNGRRWWLSGWLSAIDVQ